MSIVVINGVECETKEEILLNLATPDHLWDFDIADQFKAMEAEAVKRYMGLVVRPVLGPYRDRWCKVKQVFVGPKGVGLVLMIPSRDGRYLLHETEQTEKPYPIQAVEFK